jgi:hypothetical protein
MDDQRSPDESVSDLVTKLGLRKFAHAFAKALEEQSDPRDMTPFLDYQEWVKIPDFQLYLSGLDHQRVLEHDSKLLSGLYKDLETRLEIESKRSGRPVPSAEELVKGQAQFFRTFGATMIPSIVWIHVLTTELKRESFWTNGGTLIKPITTIISKIARTSDQPVRNQNLRSRQISTEF